MVDDNAVNRLVARRTLQGLGAKVELLASGEACLTRLQDQPSRAVSILFIDLHMPPGINGWETARRIRSLETSHGTDMCLPWKEAAESAATDFESSGATHVSDTQASHHPKDAGAHPCTSSVADMPKQSEEGFATMEVGGGEAQQGLVRGAVQRSPLEGVEEQWSATQENESVRRHCTSKKIQKEEEEELGESGEAQTQSHRHCIIALTADVDLSVRQACSEAGMDGVLGKPINTNDLLSILKKVGR